MSTQGSQQKDSIKLGEINDQKLNNGTKIEFENDLPQPLCDRNKLQIGQWRHSTD